LEEHAAGKARGQQELADGGLVLMGGGVIS